MAGYSRPTRGIPNLRCKFGSPRKAVKIGTLIVMLMVMLSCTMPAPIISSGGDKAIDITNNLLEQHITQVKHPRILTIEDIRDYERYEMEGHSFLLKGDFNKDGHNDYAIAGKCDGPSLFVCILTAKNDLITVEYMYQFPFPHDRAFLSLEPGAKYIIENVNEKYDVIKVAMALGTDWVWLIAWDGKKYIRSETYETK